MEKLDLQVIQQAQAQKDELDKLDLKDMWGKLDEMLPPEVS
jgi:hypothetical protein